MKLIKVDISNFRSIKETSINFNDSCIILVGDNEAGKSNTLKALAGGIDKSLYAVSPQDKRKSLSSETIDENNFYIRYVFELNVEEIVDSLDWENKPGLFEYEGKNLSLHQFIKKFFSVASYKTNIATQKSFATYWSLPEDKIVVKKDFYIVKSEFTDEKGNAIEKDSLTTINNEHTSDTALTLKEYIEIIGSAAKDYITENLPEAYLWRYDDKYLLPNSVSITDFRNNPDNYLSLKNIFGLSGLSDIDDAFNQAKATDGSEDYINLLERVSRNATEAFSKKWGHFKKIELDLRKDGDNIIVKVKSSSNVRYDMSDRSDGFKRFISILLVLSTQVDTEEIKDAFIFIDEPDNSLSPSGCKYLRDELLAISQKNIVVYTTHSPFMIDNGRVGRHIMLQKDDKTDITSFELATPDTYGKNELLLHALGTSAFEFICDKNLLFEGEGDCKMFLVAMQSTSNKTIIKKFEKIGTSFAHGAPSIKNITPVWNLAKKKLTIFTDSDESSNTARESYKTEKGYEADAWLTYEDLGGQRHETIEDYINDDLLKKALEHINSDIDIATRETKKVMQFLETLSKDNKKSFKEYIYDNLKPTNIKAEYFTIILKNLADKL
ncbi:MAG: ATP-binding protein [Rickettsiales bacterium]|jgi:predicted ATP-dependent endonuclease of OLD family|nr:ATP-binding protein [Rickettsiales bacterium]